MLINFVDNESQSERGSCNCNHALEHRIAWHILSTFTAEGSGMESGIVLSKSLKTAIEDVIKIEKLININHSKRIKFYQAEVVDDIGVLYHLQEQNGQALL